MASISQHEAWSKDPEFWATVKDAEAMNGATVWKFEDWQKFWPI